MKRTLMLALTLVFSLACQPAEDVDSHIARIESELLPRLVIRGELIQTATLEDRMAQLRVPGVSIAVINNGEIEWARGYGMADVASGTPVTENTLFQAASISKPVAATAALRLVELGELDLDEDVNRRLTSWQIPETRHTDRESVTLRKLVTHSAGLTVHGFPGYGPEETVPSTVGVLQGDGNTAAILSDTTPGELWRYSGGGYTVMQLLLADVAGEPFAELMQDLVLDPVGMKTSTYEQPLPQARRAEAATAYRGDGTEVDGKWHTYPEMAAAGLWTTPSDLALWALAVQRARAGDEDGSLSPQLVDNMLQPHLNNWGLGPSLDEDGVTFGHGGSNAGFRCQLVAFVEGGQGAAVMTNSDNGSTLAAEILTTIADEYGWGILAPTEKEVAQLEAALMVELAGRYEIVDYGIIQVEAGDNRLLVTLPDGEQLVLRPESETVFFWETDAEAKVTFMWEAGEVVGFESQGERARKVK
jgi:CubicO group peptidase (beta-lactamase class C family)